MEERVTIEPLDEDFLALSFPYDERLVARVRALGSRRWNKNSRRWEVNIRHLGEIVELFNLDPKSLDRKIWRRYQMLRIMGQKAKIHVGHVMAHLEGECIPFADIDEATSYFVPGYKFMPRYVKGQWDGRRHLYNAKKHTFPAGLVDRVLEVLEAEGIDVKITREAEPECLPLDITASPLKPRDYQTRCVEAALSHGRGILELATGAGKTAIAGMIIRALNRPTFFFVHTRDLLHQTCRALSKQLGIPIGQVGDGVIDLRPVTVATIQTCAGALGLETSKPGEDEVKLERDKTDIQGHRVELLKALREAPVVFFDECHHLPADTCYGLAMQTLGASFRFGLSATPYRRDHQDILLEAALGQNLFRANASVLIEQGFLVPPRIRFYAVPALKIMSGRVDYQEIYQDYIVENKRRNALIVEKAQALVAAGKSTLILVSQVTHGEALRRLMPDVPLVQGSDAATKRHKIFRELQEGNLPMVIATTLADEGLDIPSLRAVILASGGKSETRALQRVGRALRSSPGKKEALIVDFYDDAPYLKDHSLERLEIFRSEPAFKVETVGFKG
ncbi:hypothetical protein CVU37_01515 [candidate division BRC1 bacterium HGW-BRC1-1]|nr:MAG: hypothetical protein CVU37_01515 [candidate division BRC1 bacterium HGW-BRC1-1]